MTTNSVEPEQGKQGDSKSPQLGEQPEQVKSVSDVCLSIEETTVVRLKERIGRYSPNTKFVYRIDEWYYPSLDMSHIKGAEHMDGKGSKQLWFVGATNEEVTQWMYGLLLRADFYKGDTHRLKELFELETKKEVTT